MRVCSCWLRGAHEQGAQRQGSVLSYKGATMVRCECMLDEFKGRCGSVITAVIGGRSVYGYV